MALDQFRRREFISFLGGAVTAYPLAARAQQVERVRRVGVLIVTAENIRHPPTGLWR